jgi:hypothetical protein
MYLEATNRDLFLNYEWKVVGSYEYKFIWKLQVEIYLEATSTIFCI